MELFIPNFDLIASVLTVAASSILGSIIYKSNPHSATNQTFFALSLVTALYAAINFFSLQGGANDHPLLAIYLLRFIIFLAVFHSFLIFHLFYIFPKDESSVPRWYRMFLIPWVIIVAILNLTPYVFQHIKSFSLDGRAMEVENGPLIPLFGSTVVALVVASFVVGIRKARREHGLERKQLIDLLVGAVITYSLLILFNFIFPTIFNNSQFVVYAPIFLMPFIGVTAYAIYRHQLLDIKVIATEAFVLIISIVYLGQLFLESTFTDRFLNGIIFVFTVFFGFLLIRSVKLEVRAREEVRQLAKRLTDTNWQLAQTNEQLRIIDQRKSEFVSIVSHQLRTPITAIKGYASLLLEDSYGKVADEQKAPIEKIFASSKRLVEMVADFLDISKIEQDTMTYAFSAVDIKAVLADIVGEFTPTADKKGLSLDLAFSDNEKFIATVDEGKIRQIISNVLDNSIKYTPKGSVHVSLEKDIEQGTIVIKVKDSGIGLSQDDIHHLFGKFTRGSGGQKQNTEGSGLGLYVAKKMLEAMHGKIWVDSDGPNMGSTFAIQLMAEE